MGGGEYEENQSARSLAESEHGLAADRIGASG